jgi:hypothetical protein
VFPPAKIIARKGIGPLTQQVDMDRERIHRAEELIRCMKGSPNMTSCLCKDSAFTTVNAIYVQPRR